MDNQFLLPRRLHPQGFSLSVLLLALGWIAAWTATPLQAQHTLGPDVVASGHTHASSGTFTLRGTAGQPATRAAASGSYALGSGFWYQVTRSAGSVTLAVYANLRALLDGPYSGSGQMTTDLHSGGHLPTNQPFDTAPWNYGGAESVSSIPSGVVDWVLVELRSGDPTSPPMTVEARRAAFLKSDGTLVETDGTSEIRFDGLTDEAYYVVVVHRNHLAVMSAAGFTLGTSDGTAGAPYDHDFTTAQTQAYGTNAMAELETGVFGLIAADGDASGGVTATDNTVWLGQNGTAGYRAGDYNLSGGVTATDQARWLTSNGTSSQVPPP